MKDRETSGKVIGNRDNVKTTPHPAPTERSRSGERAFSRIDLLVTVAMIGLLGGLWQPLWASPRGKGETALCVNHLRRLHLAWQMYAEDNRGVLPGNTPDAGPGKVWVYYVTDPPQPNASAQLLDPRYSQLGPYVREAGVYRCPQDKSVRMVAGRRVPTLRSYSMNAAVGTKADGRAVDAGWLDGNYTHVAGRTWYTYGRLDAIVNPPPDRLWVFIDEHPASINDGGFAVIMTKPEQMIDWPGVQHDFGAGVGFADGHVEIHKWKDARTRVVGTTVNRVVQNASPDIRWLQDHTTAKLP